VKHNLIMLEGRRLIQDALDANIQPKIVFFSRLSDVALLRNLSGRAQVYKVPYNDIKLWSDLVTSPGLIGIFNIPDQPCVSENPLPVTVICDQIREPGNLGSLMRNSAAAGVSKIILTTGCVDPWDPKVLRGGSGAHFKVALFKDATWSQISEGLDPSTRVLVADNTSEGGSSREALPSVPYFALDYKEVPEVALVIGGETQGLSEEAFMLAQDFNGCRINIPLSNQVESLNSAAAAGIILFELKRQLMLLKGSC